MISLISLIYASDASPCFLEHEIPDLLRSIRPANARLGITGMLLYNRHSFLQIMEGSRDAVQPLYDRIADDPRHMCITRLVLEPVLVRAFSDWTMDFATVDSLDVPELVELAAPKPSFVSLGPAAAKSLLVRMRKPSWQKGAMLFQVRDGTG